MRRGSVIGPLLLILIGGLLLMNNLRPELSVLEGVIRYFPFLLIGWGFLRLCEILYWAYGGKPLPERGISGGEWGLIVLLTVLASGAFVVRQRVGWPPDQIRVRGIEVFGETYDYQIDEQTFTAGKASRVVIENLRGNTRVVGADAAEVKVSGRKTVRTLQQSDADESDKITPLEIVNQGDAIVIRTNQDRVGSERRLTADLEITVPRGVSVEGRGRYGDFDFTDIGGDVEVSSDNAGVRIQNVQGNVRIDLRKSDIVRAINVRGNVDLKGRGDDVEIQDVAGQVTVNGAYFGELQFRNLAKLLRFEGPQTNFRVERCPGQIRMARSHFEGENLIGPMQITGKSKDIQIAGFTGTLEISIERGDIELKPSQVPLGRMEIKTRAGNIVFGVPEKASFDLRAESEKGDVENEFGPPFQADSSGRGGSLRGSTGDGPSVVLTTGRGSVTIRKDSGEMRTLSAEPKLQVERN